MILILMGNNAFNSKNMRSLYQRKYPINYNTDTNFNIPSQMATFEQQYKFKRTIDRRMNNINSYNLEFDYHNSQNLRSNI